MLWLAEPEYERRTVMQVLQNGFIDGVIVSSMPIDEKMIEALIASQLPFILIGRHPQHPEVSFVDVENQVWRQASCRTTCSPAAGGGLPVSADL